jgi:hypothetical protein
MDRYTWTVFSTWNNQQLRFDGFRTRASARTMARNLRKTLQIPAQVQGADVTQPNRFLKG